MHLSFLSSILFGSSLAIATAQLWPSGPFITSGRWIHNSQGSNVTYAGVNWPGAADVMIPEGLQYASIKSIVSGIKSLGMNVIRLTFAIEMIDDILDDGGDVTVQTALTSALGVENGCTLYKEIVKNNPSFSSATTRLQVYDAIAAECFKQQIYVHLDNHMSNGYWCCSETDGDAWFGDTYFDVAKWKRGLEYMVKHSASWGNLMSIGLRNELRKPSDNATLATTYKWSTWYTNMVSAAQTVNSANPDILIFFSGLNFDTTLTPIVEGADLGNGVKFSKSDFPFENKIVLELHNYQNSASSCNSIQSSLYGSGFKALNESDPSAANVLPVVLTEWGHDQNDYEAVYASCLRTIIPEMNAGWMVWVLAGSYYIRTGTQDFDETWGLYDHTWSNWRSADAIAALKAMVQNSLA